MATAESQKPNSLVMFVLRSKRVEHGSQVIIEREDLRPLAVISSPQRSGSTIADILPEAWQRNSTVTLDEDFGKDLDEIIASHQQPWNPPSWD